MEPRLAGGADPKLESLLKHRLLRSEGEENAHCFVKPALVTPGLKEVDEEDTDAVDDCETIEQVPNAIGSVAAVRHRFQPPPLSTAAADIAAGSPHFCLDTPTQGTPRDAEIAGTESKVLFPSPLKEDELERRLSSEEVENEVQYEWQFEIMNRLPHDKAVALVNLLKDTHREKAEATAAAEQLQKEVSLLQEQQRPSEDASSGDKVAVEAPGAAQAEAIAAPSVRQASSVEGDAGAARGKTRRWALPVLACLALGLAAAIGSRNSLHLSSGNARASESQREDGKGLAPSVQEPVAAVVSEPQQPAADARVESSSPVDSQVEKALESSLPVNAESSVAPADVPTLPAALNPVQDAGNGLPSKAEPSAGPAAGAVQVVSPQISADLLGNAVVQLHHPALSQDLSAPRDATTEMAAALAYFPYVTKAHRLGRLIVQREALQGGQAVATALIYVGNDGGVTWPAASRLRLVTGPDMGLYILPIETEVPPGAHVELSLQFVVKSFDPEVKSQRSGWVLENAGEPFGPLLLLEVYTV